MREKHQHECCNLEGNTHRGGKAQISLPGTSIQLFSWPGKTRMYGSPDFIPRRKLSSQTWLKKQVSNWGKWHWGKTAKASWLLGSHKVSLACSISPKCWNPHLASQTTLTGSPPPDWDTDTSSGPTESLVPSGPFRWCHPVATPGLPNVSSGAFTGHLISYPRPGSPSSRLSAKFSKLCSLAMKGLFSLAVECSGFCLFPHRAVSSVSGCSSLPARPTHQKASGPECGPAGPEGGSQQLPRRSQLATQAEEVIWI